MRAVNVYLCHLYAVGDGNGNSIDNYIAVIKSGKACIGAPIMFFFTLGTTNLTDPSQLVNLDEIVRVARKYNLRIRVTGAADSDTGTPDINTRLGNDRADYIITQLTTRGFPATRLTKRNSGGISRFTPSEANRHTIVEFFP